MSVIHVRQIKAALEKEFGGLVDMSDYAGKAQSEVDSAFLSRALAGMAVVLLTEVSADVAAKAITDGAQDNGLDAVYYHRPERVLYLVQSKWDHGGTGSLERGDAQKFIKGFQDLVNVRFDRFNPKVAALRADIEEALNDARTRFMLVVAYSGQAPLSSEVHGDFSDVLAEMNDPRELVTLRLLRQSNLHAAIAEGVQGEPIDVDVALFEWGQTQEPYQAYYGQVAAADVAGWWSSHYPRLFAPNIRLFLGDTDVNESLVATLAESPEKFWYFNNGITALCSTAEKKPVGGSSRQSGIFECKDFRIVNGAQTAGAIASAAAKHPEAVEKAKVPIRIISLARSPDAFDREVTRSNNTQNRIERRDFVALDSEQERIKTELHLEGLTYTYKSGESAGGAQAGFDLVEATVARACLQPRSELAVQAKREIGRLWEDIDKPPYKILFNAGVSGLSIWKLVQAVRIVDESLSVIGKDAGGRERLLAVHGNRFITHLVLTDLAAEIDGALLSLPEALQDKVKQVTVDRYGEVLAAVNDLFPDSYLGSLFKNRTKCQEVRDRVIPPTGDNG